MDTFIRFLYEFVNQLVSGIWLIFEGLFNGIKQMFNIADYIEIIRNYYADFTGPEWVLVVLTILFIVGFLGLIIALIWFILKKYIKFKKPAIDQEKLMEEVENLNQQVVKLSKEKEEILSMKVSQLGLRPDESAKEEPVDEDETEIDPNSDKRFSKLTLIDQEYENYKPINYNNSFDLPEFCHHFRNFAASKLRIVL